MELVSTKEKVEEGEYIASSDNAAADYMKGDSAPIAGSLLLSTSKYLNSPNYRDVFTQFSLRKVGRDTSSTYLIPKMVQVIEECLDKEDYYKTFMAERAAKPEFGEWLDARHENDFQPDQMRHYKSGTLGATIRDFIEKSGMEMQFMMKGQKPSNDIEYMLKVRVYNHDIEHMVTGFGPNILGELALGVMNIVSIANYFSPEFAKYMSEHNMFTTTTALFRNGLHSPELMPHIWEAYRQGIEAGQGIKKPLILIPWHEYLDWQMDDIAADLGFKRGPGEAWMWSQEAAMDY